MIDAKGWLIPIFCLCVAAMLPDASTKAESYVAGQFGLLAHGTYNDPDNAVSDLKLKNSLMYGAKLGHYMDTLKYFGVETEAYTTTPHIKQQAVAINGAPAGTVSGSHLRVTTWTTNLVYRYPGEVFQPYAGWERGYFLREGQMQAGQIPRFHQV